MYMDMLKNFNRQEIILLTVFVIYLIGNFKLPNSINELVDNSFGNVIVILLALALFINTSPILGVVGFLVAYEIIRRASISTGTDAIKKYLPSEENKAKKMEQYQPPMSTPDITLEEEMIDNIVEFTENNDLPESNVKPILDNNYGAEQL
jgi:hypothetical protein